MSVISQTTKTSDEGESLRLLVSATVLFSSWSSLLLLLPSSHVLLHGEQHRDDRATVFTVVDVCSANWEATQQQQKSDTQQSSRMYLLWW